MPNNTTIHTQNPWKGLEFYTIEDSMSFFGRDDEKVRLAEIVSQHPVTILYGPSGVGKSSLINAGLRPCLPSRKYFFVYIRSLDYQQGSDGILRQVREQVEESARAAGVDISPLLNADQAGDLYDSLWFFLKYNEFWNRENFLMTPVIVLDQFEELFTKSEDESIPAAFLSELDNLSSMVPPLSIRQKLESLDLQIDGQTNLRFVLSIREDFIPRIDDYIYSLQLESMKRCRFSISLMTEAQALSVIEQPAPSVLEPGVSTRILSTLSNQSKKYQGQRRFEPFLLSLFMYRLYLKMEEKHSTQITSQLVDAFGPNIVADYYKESMLKVSSAAVKYLENCLLTSKGFRDSVSLDKILESRKVTAREVQTLLKTRIIKQERNNGVERIEYTHDILSGIAQRNRTERQNKRRNTALYGGGSAFFIVLAAALIGWQLSTLVSSLTIPIITGAGVLCFVSLIGARLEWRKAIQLALWGVAVGVAYVLSQFTCYLTLALMLAAAGLGLWVSYQQVSQFTAQRHRIWFYPRILAMWSLVFVLLPCLGMGYNIFVGQQYQRGSKYEDGLFYIKDSDGRVGLRDRWQVLVPPMFDDGLERLPVGYAYSQDGKFGLLDDDYQKMTEALYDSIGTENDGVYRYVDGAEVFDNGLMVRWNQSLRPMQKEIVRNIVNNLVRVEGGTFRMGRRKMADGEHPINGEENVHQVRLTDYYISRYETTLEEWTALMMYNPCDQSCPFPSETDYYPVHNISYPQCTSFLLKLCNSTGLAFSLPSEAQWEYAARGGQMSKGWKYSGGDILTDCGWVHDNSGLMPHPVGTGGFACNELGLYDMTGNVAEWCQDFMSPDFYAKTRQMSDPVNPVCTTSSGNKRVFRGGTFDTHSNNNYRTTARQFADADQKFSYPRVGIRLVVNPKQ